MTDQSPEYQRHLKRLNDASATLRENTRRIVAFDPGLTLGYGKDIEPPQPFGCTCAGCLGLHEIGVDFAKTNGDASYVALWGHGQLIDIKRIEPEAPIVDAARPSAWDHLALAALTSIGATGVLLCVFTLIWSIFHGH